MATKRHKIQTESELRAAARRIALLTVELGNLKARQDEEIVNIRDTFAGPIEVADKSLKAEIAAAKAWAIEHKAEFRDPRSKDLGLASIGFRDGMPKLRILGKLAVDEVINRCLSMFPRRDYVRTVDELNRAAIIADRDKLTKDEQTALGVAIEQDEAFFVEVKLEDACRASEEGLR